MTEFIRYLGDGNEKQDLLETKYKMRNKKRKI